MNGHSIFYSVAGGAGAMWGSSEVLTLRNPQTQETWRWIALTFGVIFFFRFLFQIKDFFTAMIDGETSIDNTAKMTRMAHIFQAKFVLEGNGDKSDFYLCMNESRLFLNF